MRARGDLAALCDRHALPGDPGAHDEGDESSLRAFGLDPPQLLGADELRVQRADPAEARRDGIGIGPDVVAVERVADLEAERVARAEPARRRAARENGVPERRRVLGHGHQLDTLLARVAGAVDHYLDPVELAHLERERRRLGQTEALERARPLHRKQRIVVGHVTDVGAPVLAILDPLEVALPVRGVDDQEVAAGLDPIDDQVVDDAARLVRQQGVLRPADLDLVDVVREQRLEQFPGGRPLDVELPHVRHVEHAAVLADGAMLRDDALVLDRHLPSGEGHHPGARRDVALVERCPQQRLHARRMLMLRHRRGGADHEAVPTLGRSAARKTGS